MYVVIFDWYVSKVIKAVGTVIIVIRYVSFNMFSGSINDYVDMHYGTYGPLPCSLLDKQEFGVHLLRRELSLLTSALYRHR